MSYQYGNAYGEERSSAARASASSAAAAASYYGAEASLAAVGGSSLSVAPQSFEVCRREETVISECDH